MADQGASFRIELGKAVLDCPDAYRGHEDPFRKHLGASIIGRECAREVWYSFHWCKKKMFSGRMVRLFNRGHLEEARFIAILRAIGFEVWQTDGEGKQFKISDHNGHFGGSMDGVGRGCPDIPPGLPFVQEFKTHGDKSFQKLKAEGVMASKWEHYVQMQIYMGKNGLEWGLYFAVNKNDDELHAEVLRFDPAVYQRYLDRACLIIMANEPPPKINESPGWFKCRFCDMRGICHLGEPVEVNCRTCAFSNPALEGKWRCRANSIDLDGPQQLAGCSGYTKNPAL